MKLCIPKEGNQVCGHFGHSPEFALVTIENGKVVKTEVFVNPGHEPGLLPKLMSMNGVDSVVAGGMGRRAMDMLEELKIKVYCGASGDIDATVEKFLKGEPFNGDNLCDH